MIRVIGYSVTKSGNEGGEFRFFEKILKDKTELENFRTELEAHHAVKFIDGKKNKVIDIKYIEF